MDIVKKLSDEFSIKLEYSKNIVDLIHDGNTIPFIARYRKEMHGTCDDQVLREFADRLAYLESLEKRKQEVRDNIEGQGKWTDELQVALDGAVTLTEVEDIYRPYKQKKKTRASVAIERGLQPLADIIFAQELAQVDYDELTAPFITDVVLTKDDAIAGAKDIIAEKISDDAPLRKTLRQLLTDLGSIEAKLDPKFEDKEKINTYEMYKEFSERISAIPSHRILAINRGENEGALKASIVVDRDSALAKIKTAFCKPSVFDAIMDEVANDCYDRLIFPSIEREVRSDLTELANEQAIKMFEVNLKPLLMQPPLKGKVIMGFDPAYRTGCKIAVIDDSGKVLDYGVVYPTPPQSKVEEAERKLTEMIMKCKVDIISIGNGTASKESEIFVCELIKKINRPVSYIVVNEAGASVYSASKLGAEEFPEYDVSIRSAVSIARRLLDPLAELIKIDVKSIGVGQYQHDMPQKRLTEVLDGVVEACVNSVGVDLNTASYSLLSFVAGLNSTIAKNIVARREEQPFVKREELLKVAKLGPKAFQQCAGFLRLHDGENVLDNTAVHPETYPNLRKLLDMFDYTDEDVRSLKLDGLREKIREKGTSVVAEEIGVGIPTLNDMVDEILKPGRDIRDSLPPPILRADLMDIKDLKEGMEIIGTVRNVIDFGAFVDIGVHHDGLVHISEISDSYIKHPSEALKVGDIVKVRVIGVDPAKQRINLSMRSADGAKREKSEKPTFDKRPNNNNRTNNNRNFATAPKREEKREEQSLDDMLKALQNKFKR